MARYESNEERLISEFNEAKFQIFRLHNIWMECKLFRERGKLIAWRWKLDTAMIELWNDAVRLDEHKEKEEDTYVFKLNKLNEDIIKVLAEKNLSEFYDILMKKEMMLRKIQEDAGKGAKFRPAEEEFT